MVSNVDCFCIIEHLISSASSPVRDPIHPVSLRVKRSSSYHGRPKSVHTPYIRSMGVCTTIYSTNNRSLYHYLVTHHAHTTHHTAHNSETVTNLTRVGGSPTESTVIVHDDKKPSRSSQTEAFISELMVLLR